MAKHHFNDWKAYAADAAIEIGYNLPQTWNICFFCDKQRYDSSIGDKPKRKNILTKVRTMVAYYT